MISDSDKKYLADLEKAAQKLARAKAREEAQKAAAEQPPNTVTSRQPE